MQNDLGSKAYREFMNGMMNLPMGADLHQRAFAMALEVVRPLILAEAGELPETDQRYLAPFMAGMRAARMAIIKRGWSMTAPITAAEVIDVIDNERNECVKQLAKGIEARDGN